MKLDASQFGWIQKMTGGALGGEAVGHSSDDGFVYEYALTIPMTLSAGASVVEVIVYRTHTSVAKSNVKVEIGREAIPMVLVKETKDHKKLYTEAMQKVIKAYESKPNKIADLPKPDVLNDIIAMLELNQMKAENLTGAIAIEKSKLAPDKTLTDAKAMLPMYYSPKLIELLKAQTPYFSFDKSGSGPSAPKKSIVELPDDHNDGIAQHKSMMQPTANLPIPGILEGKSKPVNVKVREPKTGRKFRA